MKVLTTPRSYGKTDPEVFAMLRAAGLEVVRNETGGILDKEGMKALLADCDGVIVGSAIVKIVAESGKDCVEPVGRFTVSLRKALDS